MSFTSFFDLSFRFSVLLLIDYPFADMTGGAKTNGRW